MASSLAIFTVTVQLAKELLNLAIVGRSAHPEGALAAARYACAKVGMPDAQIENCTEHPILGKEMVVGAPQEILIVDIEVNDTADTSAKKKARIKETRFCVVTAQSFSTKENLRASCFVHGLLPKRGLKIIRMRRVPFLAATNVAVKPTGAAALKKHLPKEKA